MSTNTTPASKSAMSDCLKSVKSTKRFDSTDRENLLLAPV